MAGTIRPLLIAALTTSAAVAAPPLLIDRDPLTRPHLLIIGTPHFGNPGLDNLKSTVPDVRTPERQKEIEAIVDKLATFKPTRVAVEVGRENQAKLDQRYADYRAGRATLRANETDQLGFRLAAKLGLPRVDAVDWNGMPAGTEADWNYWDGADANGYGDRLKAWTEHGQKRTDAEDARLRCTDVAEWLRANNSADNRAESNRSYFELTLMGGDQRSPGATWLGSWYARNFRIFANLVRLADRPDDRVVVFYGAGHGFLLDQFARQSKAFVVHDSLDYLPPPRLPGPNCG